MYQQHNINNFLFLKKCYGEIFSDKYINFNLIICANTTVR